MSPLKTIN